MSNCNHKNRTIDCICNDCGCDLIVDPMEERIRKQERERIESILQTEGWDLFTNRIDEITQWFGGDKYAQVTLIHEALHKQVDEWVKRINRESK